MFTKEKLDNYDSYILAVNLGVKAVFESLCKPQDVNTTGMFLPIATLPNFREAAKFKVLLPADTQEMRELTKQIEEVRLRRQEIDYQKRT